MRDASQDPGASAGSRAAAGAAPGAAALAFPSLPAFVHGLAFDASSRLLFHDTWIGADQ